MTAQNKPASKEKTPTRPTPAGKSGSRTKPPVGDAEGTGRPREIGGRDGPDPTRYGDWEKNGRCVDF